ncbi:hypothetical protein ACVWWO_009639 [Bradyrhizobium sp. F1.13.1]
MRRHLFRRPARGALGFLLGLDAIPDFLDVGGGEVAVLVGENVRMAPDHFSRDGLDDIAKSKGVLLRRHLGVEDDLEQQVAELLAEIVEIAAADGLDYLIGFLNRIGRDGRKILLEVPGAAGHRRAQRRHDLDQAGNVAGRGHCGAVSWLSSLMPKASPRSQRSTAEQGDFHRLAGRIGEPRGQC